MDNGNDVLIIGSGPGGLALAQILRAKGVPFQVFERETAHGVHREGWSVALIEVLKEFPHLLAEDMQSLEATSVNHNQNVHDTMTILFTTTGQKLAVQGGRSVGQPGSIVRADRKRLRDFLRQHIDVQTGKYFSHYEEDEAGVMAFFNDGTRARGSILVGCDGSHSKVREQLLSANDQKGSSLELSEWIPIYGECEMTREQFEPIHRFSSAGYFAAGPDIRHMIGPRWIKDDFSCARYYWSIVWRSKTPPEDSAWVQKASKEDLYDHAMKLVKDFAPSMTAIFRYTKPSGMFSSPPKFYEFVTPTSLPHSRVTILGDAAHTMLPFKGQGANTAVMDACDLGKLLVQRRGKSEPAKEDIRCLLQEYASLMLPRGRDLVLSTRASGQEMMGVMAAMAGRIDTSLDPR